MYSNQNWEKRIDDNEYFFDLQDEQVVVRFVGGKLIIKIDGKQVYNNIPFPDVVGFKDVDIDSTGIILTCSVEKRIQKDDSLIRYLETEIRTLDPKTLNVTVLNREQFVKLKEHPYRWVVSNQKERLLINDNPDGSTLTQENGLYCHLFQTDNKSEWILTNINPPVFSLVSGQDDGGGAICLGNNCVLGDFTDNTVDKGMFKWDAESSTVTEALVDLNNVMKLLVPDAPPKISHINLYCPNSYDAYKESTNELHHCINDINPIIKTLKSFEKPTLGLLTALIDDVDCGNKILTTENNVGIYDSLCIINQKDTYKDIDGSEGFWMELEVNINSIKNLDYGKHTFQLLHQHQGKTLLFSIYVDDPSLPNVDVTNITLPLINSRYISGVPGLSETDEIEVSCIIKNAVKTHYSNIQVGQIQSLNLTNLSLNPIVPPSFDEEIQFNNLLIFAKGYSENININIIPYNSANIPGIEYTGDLKTRVDLLSIEDRVQSGSGLFPTIFGGQYNSEFSLRDILIEELQLLNGKYQIPTGDYTLNQPTKGPDYSSGMGVSMRYVTFQTINLIDRSSFLIKFNNISGDWDGIVTSGISIHAHIGNSIFWIDCNSPYPGFGNPSENGDKSMVFSESTSILKYVTLGNAVISGLLHIRIGLPYNSNKQFSSITIV